MKKGDYEWRQVSMWESTPKNCVEKFVTIETGLSGKVTCRFYLKRVKAIVSESHYKTEVVESLEGVPEDVLNWRGDSYRIKSEGDAA